MIIAPGNADGAEVAFRSMLGKLDSLLKNVQPELRPVRVILSWEAGLKHVHWELLQNLLSSCGNTGYSEKGGHRRYVKRCTSSLQWCTNPGFCPLDQLQACVCMNAFKSLWYHYLSPQAIL
jgi:hypothetical protein